MTGDTSSRILKRLAEQEKEEGKLPLLLEFYRKLLNVQSSAQEHLVKPPVQLGEAEIRSRFSQGKPLLDFDGLSVDWPEAREVFAGVLDIFARYPQLFGELPEKLKNKEAGRLFTKQAARNWYNGKKLPPILREGVNEALIQTLFQYTMQPFLASHALAIKSSVKTPLLEMWRRGYCPVCGGIPDLAYLEKEVGARWLLCSRCDFAWVFQRLECPFCRNKDQNTLSFFSDDEGRYRLYVCENCRGYLKAIDLRRSESEVIFPLERFYTLDLDSQARERGYHPGAASK